jgi:hypothetical protein
MADLEAVTSIVRARRTRELREARERAEASPLPSVPAPPSMDPSDAHAIAILRAGRDVVQVGRLPGSRT